MNGRDAYPDSIIFTAVDDWLGPKYTTSIAGIANHIIKRLEKAGYVINRKWSKECEAAEESESVELVAWSIPGLMEWIKRHDRTDVTIQCGYCLMDVGGFKDFCVHMLTCAHIN